MNLLISKEEHEILQKRVLKRYLIGSKMYGVEGSDTDYLCVYKTFDEELYSGLPNFHQFQYTEDNTDYIYTSDLQFWKNFYSGDSTINADVIIFGESDFTNEQKLNFCRTYKVIKAFIGFAKRDLKMHKQGIHKLIHAQRSLYCADCLLKGKLPELEGIQWAYKNTMNVDNLKLLEQTLREKCNKMYENNELLNYYITGTNNSLIEKLYNSNNTKEFHYA